MNAIISIVITVALGSNPEWFKATVNEKTSINGVSFEDFINRGGFLRARGINSLPSQLDSCHVKFELAINQDVSGSFGDVVGQFRDNLGQLMKEVSGLYPGSRIGFSTFSDKPIPISGYGDHGDFPKKFRRDHCYKLKSPLTSDVASLRRASAFLNISGGGDYKENLLGSLVSIANDPDWGFSAGHDDDAAIIRVVLSITDALPHTAGDAAENVRNWNTNWGTEDFEDDWALSYGSCKTDSRLHAQLTELREKFDAGTLTTHEEIQFNEIRDTCGPWKFDDVFLTHGNVVDTPENCLRYDYPSSDEAMNALKKIEALIPVMLTPSADTSLNFVKYYGNCPTANTEAQCLREHYQQMFAAGGLNGLFYSLEGHRFPYINDIIVFVLNEIKGMYCEGQLFPTEISSTTTGEKSSLSSPTALAPPTTIGGACGCAGNACPCDQEMRIHVGVDVPVSKWEAFLALFTPWVK